MAGIRIRRRGRGRARTRPDRVLGDKAYSNRAIRSYLRRRHIKATIPSQPAHRLRRARKGGRSATFNAEIYKQRNIVERRINKLKGTVRRASPARAVVGIIMLIKLRGLIVDEVPIVLR
jgi:transposase